MAANGKDDGFFRHEMAHVNGINMHIVKAGPEPSAGKKPPIIMAHGFPHTWWSWNRQMRVLAAQGYPCIAYDIRGMGDTDAPTDPAEYDCDHTIGDLTGLLKHLKLEKAVFAGLDFGLFAIYDLGYRHPEKIIAQIALNNPSIPHNPDTPPLEEARAMGQKHFYHMDYFMAPGVAEKSLNAEPRKFLERVFWALSGDYHYIDVWKHPSGTHYIDALPEAPPLPWSWLSKEDMDVFVKSYDKTGFLGGMNWYRAMDLRWAQRKPYEHKKNTVPYFLIAAEADTDIEAFHGDDPIGRLPNEYSDIREVAHVKKAGHMLQMERSDEVNALMLKFMSTLS